MSLQSDYEECADRRLPPHTCLYCCGYCGSVPGPARRCRHPDQAIDRTRSLRVTPGEHTNRRGDDSSTVALPTATVRCRRVL